MVFDRQQVVTGCRRIRDIRVLHFTYTGNRLEADRIRNIPVERERIAILVENAAVLINVRFRLEFADLTTRKTRCSRQVGDRKPDKGMGFSKIKRRYGCIREYKGLNPRRPVDPEFVELDVEPESETLAGSPQDIPSQNIFRLWRAGYDRPPSGSKKRKKLQEIKKLAKRLAYALGVSDGKDKRYRTGGEQRVVVEHVHVHEGSRVIVGTVHQGGRETSNTRDQGHAKAVTHAPGTTLRSADPEADTAPVAGGERPEAVPHARRR